MMIIVYSRDICLQSPGYPFMSRSSAPLSENPKLGGMVPEAH